MMSKAKLQEFEASVSSGIKPEIKRIKKYDENRKKERSIFKKYWKVVLTLVVVAAGCYFWNPIAGYIAGAIALAALIFTLIKTRVPKQRILEAYTEGALCPGMIINLNPLTIMVLATMNADDRHPNRFACFKLIVENLPDTRLALYEKLPASCMFDYNGGGYHYAVQPFPLCWATGDKQAIDAALAKIEQWNAEHHDEFEAIKKAAEQFPNLKNKYMLLLDENYQPIGQKYYWDTEYHTLGNTLMTDFPKNYPPVAQIEDDIPAAGLYNEMIKLAVKCRVYEYITTPEQTDGSPLLTNNTGFFTYMGDKVLFLEAVAKRKAALKPGEYPLIGGLALITNKGFWLKEQFTPWEAAAMEIDFSHDEYLSVLLNGKSTAMFVVNQSFYTKKEDYDKEAWGNVFLAEKQNLNVFLEELRALCLRQQ